MASSDFRLSLNLRFLSVVGAMLLLAVFSALAYVWTLLNKPLNIQQDVLVYEVEQGSSLTAVTNELATAGILDAPGVLTLYARLRGDATSIQTGEYELHHGITPREFLGKMLRGDTLQYRVTLVEGWTLAQVLNAFAQSPQLEQEINSSDPHDIADQLGFGEDSAEGMFYPDTYFFTKGSSDREILKRARQRLDTVLEEAWQNRLGALPYDDPYDALILASIIEKESAQGSERGHIAGVFVRRLEQGMRLQSDPTVIYGMGTNYDGDIRRQDLQEVTPYNTYRIDGLPPSPIALAGIESITASMNPLPSDYLYFVSRGDGTHYFSSTLEEHNAAVNRFQLQSAVEEQ